MIANSIEMKQKWFSQLDINMIRNICRKEGYAPKVKQVLVKGYLKWVITFDLNRVLEILRHQKSIRNEYLGRTLNKRIAKIENYIKEIKC